MKEARVLQCLEHRRSAELPQKAGPLRGWAPGRKREFSNGFVPQTSTRPDTEMKSNLIQPKATGMSLSSHATKANTAANKTRSTSPCGFRGKPKIAPAMVDHPTDALQRVLRFPINRIRPADVTVLQRTIGNRAVQQLISRKQTDEARHAVQQKQGQVVQRQDTEYIDDWEAQQTRAPEAWEEETGAWEEEGRTIAHENVESQRKAGLLMRGSTGAKVTIVQEKLRALGFLSGKADGYFGSQTHEAVTAFQKETGLTVDGIVGKKTFTMLGISVTNKTPKKPAEEKKGAPVHTDYDRINCLGFALNYRYNRQCNGTGANFWRDFANNGSPLLPTICSYIPNAGYSLFELLGTLGLSPRRVAKEEWDSNIRKDHILIAMFGGSMFLRWSGKVTSETRLAFHTITITESRYDFESSKKRAIGFPDNYLKSAGRAPVEYVVTYSKIHSLNGGPAMVPREWWLVNAY